MRKTHRYVVGFDDDTQPVYGKDEGLTYRWADPMTLRQAHRKLEELDGAQRVIYKLVPVREKRK